MDKRGYSIISWNVNQYEKKIHNWLMNYAKQNKPDVVFLSETKRSIATLENWLQEYKDYSYIMNVHNPSHHHGVAMLIKKNINYVQEKVDFNVPCRADNKGSNPTDGRIIHVLLENRYAVIGTYVPNSGFGRNSDNYDYRINEWDPALQAHLNQTNRKYSTIWIGDINVAPSEEDSSHPNVHSQKPGFTDLERKSFENFMKDDEWVDIWRLQHPGEKKYSWRGKCTDGTRGLRLDNTIISKKMIGRVTNSFMIFDCPGESVSKDASPLSDHIPIGIVFHSD